MAHSSTSRDTGRSGKTAATASTAVQSESTATESTEGANGALDGRDEPTYAVSATDELNRVRDILFGAQVREQTQRATKLEETIARMGAELSREMDLRFQTLEASLAKHVADLNAQLAQEQAARAQAVDALQQSLRELGHTLSAGTTLLGEHTKQEQAALRQHLVASHEQSQREWAQRYDDLTKKMERALSELRSEKVTRAALADLFAKSAQSLSAQIATNPDT
ncbi:MAG: hypothetical protein U0172_13980 [Nitrospiraceae bacterium]